MGAGRRVVGVAASVLSVIDADAVAAQIPLKAGGPTLIAIDGVDGSGKTTFAAQPALA